MSICHDRRKLGRVAGIVATLAFPACVTTTGLAAIPAFPGATGPGAYATGGRGGDVYRVTSLDPDKNGTVPGSLQYGINTAPSSGRIIVFDVGGTIFLDGQSANDTLRYGKGNLTIAGQTAPGPGITIAGTGTKWTGTNVILRNLSVRPNRNAAGVTFDAFSLQLKNSIVDHVTATWYTDEGISITDAGQDSTVQYAIISEGLNYAGHGFGSIIATEMDGTHYSFHHNLYAHNASRMPRVGSEIGQVGAVVNFSNNVLYNWGSTKVGYGGRNQPGSTNFINNYYINGPSNATTNLFVGDDDPPDAGFTKIHESGNFLDSNRNATIDGVAVGGSTYFRGGLTRYAQPFPVRGVDAHDTAPVALQRTLDFGGANWWNRGPIDQRIVGSVRSISGRVINDLSASPQSGEWATLMAQRPDAHGNAPFTRPANWDTDRDGMPDAWERAVGTNPGVANHNADFDNDGYTDLEEYINDLAAWPAPTTLVFTNANNNGRYEEIGNWGNTWQPSRFDAAQINSGVVTVTSPGQTARTLSIAAGSSSTATLNVAGGWIDVRETLAIGAGGNGTMNQSGGLVRAGTSIVIGNTSRAGAIQLTGGTLATPLLSKGHAASVFNFTGGVLRAEQVNFSLVNDGGTLAPGSDLQLQLIAAASMPDINGQLEPVPSLIGTTRVVGNLTLLRGLLQIDLASDSRFDQLLVEGTLQLGGSLGVTLVDGYLPGSGDRWLIARANSITGRFAEVTPGFGIEINGGDLYLVVPEPTSLLPVGMAALALRRRSHR